MLFRSGKDGFTVIDHRLKVCYTGQSLYEYAYKQGNILDGKGTKLEKRDPVTYEEISPYVLEGTVDTEDVRFYEHEGVDIPGIARAFVNNLRGGDLEGASTITQQLVRNTVLSEEATDISFERKIREAELEDRKSTRLNSSH